MRVRKPQHRLVGMTKRAPFKVRCACGFKTNARPTAEQARMLYSEHIRDVIARETE